MQTQGISTMPVLRSEYVSKRGRVLTIIMFSITVLLLLATFLWIGARRINNFFVSRGDAAIEARDYKSAQWDYTWAIRFDRQDAHAYLERGFTRQQLALERVLVLELEAVMHGEHGATPFVASSGIDASLAEVHTLQKFKVEK